MHKCINSGGFVCLVTLMGKKKDEKIVVSLSRGCRLCMGAEISGF